MLLRKQGLSYSEISRKLKVPESTLSSWLHNVPLSVTQTKALVKRRIDGSLRGARVRRDACLNKTETIIARAATEITKIPDLSRFLIGIALYWAEGSKPRPPRNGELVKFSNTDPMMIKFFYNWLLDFCCISTKQIIIELYIHKSVDPTEALKHWAQHLGIAESEIRLYRKEPSGKRTYYKPYKGLVRLCVRKSTDLNRRISGWIKGVVNNCGIV